MQNPDAHDRLLAQALASMPVEHPICILCGGEPPDYIGVGKIDGITMAYCVCQQCLTPDYVEAVIARIRSWHASCRCN